MVGSSQIRCPVSQMSLDNPKYDVAISFLAKDEPIAAAIDLKLRESLDVFFFPNKQKDLAGTDGMESMRTPFLKDCRVMVVLYREPWGKTRWTAIEETAIKEACFNEGWKRQQFLNIKLPMPNVDEQERGAALFAEVSSLKDLQDETTSELDLLLPSVVSQAFSGVLQ